MNTSKLSKILIVLVILLIISIVGLVATSVLGGNDSKETDRVTDTDPTETTKTAETTADPDETTAGGETTKEDGTSSVITTKPDDETTKNPDETTKAPEETTVKPTQKAPAGYKLKETTFWSEDGLYSDAKKTRPRFNTSLTVSGEANEDGTVHLKVELKLTHFALYCGSIKDCFIKVNGSGSTFAAPGITYEGSERVTDVLSTYECDVFYGEKVNLSAFFNYGGTIGEEPNEHKFNGLTVNGTVTIK